MDAKITVEQATDWVLRHRKGKAFSHYTPDEVRWAILRAISLGGLGYTLDGCGRLVGICCATPNHVEKTLRVHNILCVDANGLPSMIAQCQKLFPGYTVTGQRRGKEVSYTPKQLARFNRHPIRL